jgi:drug/metabolite transporter (DMT)-like permease
MNVPQLSVWRLLLPATFGALLIAFSAIFVRLADVSPSTAAVFRCTYALPALGLLAARERRQFGARPFVARRAALLAGVFFAADLTFLHHSITAVGAGLATVLANTQVVIVGIIAGLVLGERPDRRMILAFPLVLVGIMLISGLIGMEAYGENPALGVFCGVLSAFGYAGFLLLLRHGNRDQRRPAGPLFDATAAAAVTAALAGAGLGDLNLVPFWPSHGWLLLLALSSQVIAWLLVSMSLPRLPAVLTSTLLLFEPIGSVFLAIVLLAETPSSVQLAGVALVAAGILLAAFGPSRTGAPATMAGIKTPHPNSSASAAATDEVCLTQ